jgi:hypothetical protein
VTGARGEESILLGLSLGSSRSRGTLPVYCKVPLFFQSAATAGEDVPAQGLWAQVPAAALEPALLPGSGMLAAGSPLAGGTAAGPTAPGRCRQSRARHGGTRAPSACPRFVASNAEAEGCGGAWSRSKNFLPIPCARGQGATSRPRSWAATRHTTVVLSAARRCAGCWIANASGFGVALSAVVANAPRNIKPPAPAVLDSKPIPLARRHGRRRRDRTGGGPVRRRWPYLESSLTLDKACATVCAMGFAMACPVFVPWAQAESEA